MEEICIEIPTMYFHYRNMRIKMSLRYSTILVLILVPARNALWCPEGCFCDNENLFVECGNEGTLLMQEKNTRHNY